MITFSFIKSNPEQKILNIKKGNFSMDELQIVTLENQNISSWNFEIIKQELLSGLTEYKNLVYTDETMQSARDDKRALNKVKEAIENARKAYKNECLRPYNDIEPKAKELVKLVDDQVKAIDNALTDYTERMRAEKEKDIRSYYKQKSGCLGEYADAVYNKIFDKKWTNSSTTKKAYEVAVVGAINNVFRDIEEIKALNCDFYTMLVNTYLINLSLEEAMEKYREYSAVAEALPQRNISAGNVDTEGNSGITCSDFSNDNSVCIRINATEKQINRLKDYMKAIGVEYEII